MNTAEVEQLRSYLFDGSPVLKDKKEDATKFFDLLLADGNHLVSPADQVLIDWSVKLQNHQFVLGALHQYDRAQGVVPLPFSSDTIFKFHREFRYASHDGRGHATCSLRCVFDEVFLLVMALEAIWTKSISLNGKQIPEPLMVDFEMNVVRGFWARLKNQ